MPSDTRQHTTAAPTTVASTCSAFAEPAEILTRLQPDDLHPAQLAGPHAWHPWSLTTAPPHDRHLRLTIPASANPDTASRLLDHLSAKLSGTPWPPSSPLTTDRDGHALHCRDDDGRRSTLTLAITTAAGHTGQRPCHEVVDRDGWPILDELGALCDRIRAIDVATPSATDLADLVRWVETKMARPPATHRVAASLDDLLHDQVRHAPTAAHRLTTLLETTPASHVHNRAAALRYLAERLQLARTKSHPPVRR
jgi:hypothetical protein